MVIKESGHENGISGKGIMEMEKLILISYIYKRVSAMRLFFCLLFF
jgi:hypothetical protein